MLKAGEGVFGFIRINGFAAKPLFWANALLPYALISLYIYITKRTRLSAISLMATVFSNRSYVSRGAYGALVGIIICIIYTYVKKMQDLKKIVHTIVIMTAGMSVAWGILIAAAMQYPP